MTATLASELSAIFDWARRNQPFDMPIDVPATDRQVLQSALGDDLWDLGVQAWGGERLAGQAAAYFVTPNSRFDDTAPAEFALATENGKEIVAIDLRRMIEPVRAVSPKGLAFNAE